MLSLALALPLSATASAGETAFYGIAGIGQFSKSVTSMREQKFEHIVPQQTDFSCGAAALATILRYAYHQPVTETDVLMGLFAVSDPDVVRRQGFSLLNLKDYVKSIGMRGRGYNISADLLERVRVPTIALIDIKGYKHFVVVKKTENNRVYIADPALGNKIMPKEDFVDSWNGILFAVIGSGFDRNSVLLSPSEPLTAWRNVRTRRPISDTELLDFGFTHKDLF